MAKKAPAASAAKAPVFTKDSLVNSVRYVKNRDLVSALLADGVEYTVDQVDEMISQYLKGKVN